MSWYWAFSLLLGLVLALMALGVPVAFAFLLTNLVGVLLFMGGLSGVTQLVANSADSVASFHLVPLPLFVLMGEVFFHSGLAVRVFDSLDMLFGRVRGRLSYLTVAGGTVFATLSGSSLANGALLGSLMAPEMIRRGYKRYMAFGPILGTGGLAMIIPPSTLAVLLGSLAGINIGALLVAGILPGLLLALFYAVLIFIQVRLDPDAAPAYDTERVSWSVAIRSFVVNVLPMGIVIFCVAGLILLGVATPTEAAAFGVLGVIALCLLFRVPLIQTMQRSLLGTVKVSTGILLIVMGSAIFSQLLAFSGASAGLIKWATSFDVAPFVILLSMFVVLLFLGMFMEQISIMMLTVPVFFPLAGSLGYDLVWFGLIVLLGLEIGLATPPLGLLLFVLHGVAPKGTKLEDVSWAAVPYIGCALLLVALIMIFPPIALYLTQFVR
ncbi:MAG: TRAP transporter large permease subunit [Pseudorhodoplanes sp.]|uniref:TRAP transporter large permease n=1 Tax=Pseudorhodoplanes sp. TaxID=1934341 RepID=UPI003D0E05A3